MAKTFEQLVPNAPKGRFDGVSRPYTPAEVEKLRGSFPIAYTLAERAANRLWESLNTMPYVHSLGAVTGNQAMQQARAGLPAIYLSGWQVAADANTAGAMYPDQSLYPANAGPELCRRINRALQRADQIEHSEGGAKIDWFVPVVADAEAGFGGPLNSFEIMKAYIEAGAAGVHFEDQLASEKKCGHMGGKVLIPTAAHERNLIAARLAADVCGTPTFVMARTDAESAKLITSDVDERDREFITGERTAEGFYRLKGGTGVDHCIKRGLAFAKYADLLWWETSTPNLDDAKRFAEAVTMAYHRYYKVDTHIVRIFNTYGPRMRLNDGRALPNFVYQALSGQPITVYGDGKQTRSFCFVSDLIDGIYKLSQSDEHMPTNIGNPAELTIHEFAERVCSHFPNAPKIIHEALPVDDPKQRRPDITKAKRLLGWEPKVSLEDGLKTTIAFFKEQYAKTSAAR